MRNIPLRQIFYHSRVVGKPDIGAILTTSKLNNGLDGLTGLLFFDNARFLQVLEGPADGVEATFDRISADPRHTDITLIRDHEISERDFSYWSMELRDPSQSSDDATWRLHRRLAQFSPNLRKYFFET